ncbi:hypothetical protein LIER_08701 [Lithospermum erythrorhizon]|uniref:Uncharacterized protein n=1 Tax=Lithospermum erythrorhizon TaxID=34254 RepID=A0AAV3PFV0_LITER
MIDGSNQEIPSTSAQQKTVNPRPDSPVMDVACEVANRLNDEELGGNPLDSDVISAEPLAIRHPSPSTTASSQARTTPSDSQTAKPIPAGSNTDKSSDTPTIICDSLPMSFLDEDLDFTQYFSIPSFVEMSLLLKGERANVVKKVAKDPVVTTSQPTVVSQSSSLSGKTPTVENRPPLFSKRQKSIAHKLPRRDRGVYAVDETGCFPRYASSSVKRIRKDYDAIREPLEIHGAVAHHLIKVLNGSHALVCRANLLEDAGAEACEKERTLQLQVVELTKENEWLNVVATLAVKEKKEATAQT